MADQENGSRKTKKTKAMLAFGETRLDPKETWGANHVYKKIQNSQFKPGQ